MPTVNDHIIEVLNATGVKFEIIGTFISELLEQVVLIPSGNKESALHSFFDKFFAGANLLDSFDHKLVIINDEVFNTEVLVALHTWFSKKCCNIKNIVYIPLSSVGVADWYQQYLKLFGYGNRGFKVVEAPMLFKNGPGYFQDTKHITAPTKQYNYYYTSYGGTYNSLPRDLLIASLLTVDCPSGVDYLANFTTDSSLLENYFESTTSFCDRDRVDKLLLATKRQFNDFGPRGDEHIDFNGFQYSLDNQAFAQVVRETTDDDQWGSFTEKTVRAFLHRQAVVPISGYASKDTLENLGFKFVDIINYNQYQYESNYGDRCRALCNVLQDLADNYSLTQLNDYYIANRDIFDYNFNYIQSGDFLKHIKKQVAMEFTND